MIIGNDPMFILTISITIKIDNNQIHDLTSRKLDKKKIMQDYQLNRPTTR